MRRRKPDEIVGVLEFPGTTRESPAMVAMMAEQKPRNVGKIRVAQGATGCRVAFSSEADMERWRPRK